MGGGFLVRLLERQVSRRSALKKAIGAAVGAVVLRDVLPAETVKQIEGMRAEGSIKAVGSLGYDLVPRIQPTMSYTCAYYPLVASFHYPYTFSLSGLTSRVRTTVRCSCRQCGGPLREAGTAFFNAECPYCGSLALE